MYLLAKEAWNLGKLLCQAHEVLCGWFKQLLVRHAASTSALARGLMVVGRFRCDAFVTAVEETARRLVCKHLTVCAGGTTKNCCVDSLTWNRLADRPSPSQSVSLQPTRPIICALIHNMVQGCQGSNSVAALRVV